MCIYTCIYTLLNNVCVSIRRKSYPLLLSPTDYSNQGERSGGLLLGLRVLYEYTSKCIYLDNVCVSIRGRSYPLLCLRPLNIVIKARGLGAT